MFIKVIVIAENAIGEADYWPCLVECSQEQYDNGDHFNAAEAAATKKDYENPFACDENEPLFRPFVGQIDWSSVPTVTA